MSTPMDSLKKTNSEAVIKETKVCPIHGEYTAEAVSFLGKMIFTSCPECIRIEEEKDRIREEEMRAEEDRQREERYVKRLYASGFEKSEIGHRFGNYIPQTEKQATAKGLAERFAKSDKLKERSLTLILAGVMGTGKTHLACAIGAHCVKRGFTVRYVTASQLWSEIRKTYSSRSGETEYDVIERYSRYDILILDEIGLQKGTPEELRAFSTILDNRHRRCLANVFCSNMEVQEVETFLGARTWERIKAGLIALPMDGESMRGKEI